MVNLSDKIRDYPGNLSGGDKKVRYAKKSGEEI